MRRNLILAGLMAAASPALFSASISQLKNVVGEGELTTALTITWGDEIALDNLVEGVKVNAGSTVEDVIRKALALDPRFYALQDANSTLVGFGFDTNGDNSAGINLGESLSLTEGVATINGEYSEAVSSSANDHWALTGEDKKWRVVLNGNDCSMGTVVKEGDLVSLIYTSPEMAYEAPEHEFYLRPADQLGLWIQESIHYDTANGKSQVYYALANLCEDRDNLFGSGFGMEVWDEAGENTITAYSASFAWRNYDDMKFTLRISSPADATLRPFLNIQKIWEEGGAKETRRIYADVDTKVSVTVAKPLTNITLEGIEPAGTLTLENMGVEIITPVYEPSDADFTGYSVRFDDESIASIYKNVNSLVAHSAGSTKMTLIGPDGTEYGEYTITVKDCDPTDKPDDEFSDGVIWLNEEWFGHTSGSLNYIDATGKVYYRAYGNQNDNKAFGCTSQFGTIYAGKLFVLSKQAWDGGDTRPVKSGGRVVVADAKTMKHLGSIDEIGGDGRSFVGITPSKGYIGHTKGIRIMNLDDITVEDEDIAGVEMTRNGQIGDMIKAGKYVFAANIGTGLVVIDTETDEVVKVIENTGVQTVTMSADGRVWLACAKTLTPIDSQTLECGDTYDIPGTITCSSGAWRHGNLMAVMNENALIWGTGTFYRWNLDEVEDPSSLEPVYTHIARPEGSDVTYGSGYASPGYDPVSDTYMYCTMPGFGTAALNNWYHFVDGKTGEYKGNIKLPLYWWFPAMPIFPDKYDAEINLEDIDMDLSEEVASFDLSKLVTDKDNHNSNISISLTDSSMLHEQEEAPVAYVTLEGKQLSIKPNKTGEHNITLVAESNGRVVSKNIKITVNDRINTGLNGIGDVEEVRYTVYNLSGAEVMSVMSSENDYSFCDTLPSGVYVIYGSNGECIKKIVK